MLCLTQWFQALALATIAVEGRNEVANDLPKPVAATAPPAVRELSNLRNTLQLTQEKLAATRKSSALSHERLLEQSQKIEDIDRSLKESQESNQHMETDNMKKEAVLGDTFELLRQPVNIEGDTVGVLPPESMEVQLAAEEKSWKEKFSASVSRSMAAANKSKHVSESDSGSLRGKINEKTRDFRSMQRKAFQQDKDRMNLRHQVDALQKQMSGLQQADQQVKESFDAEFREEQKRLTKLDKQKTDIATQLQALRVKTLTEKRALDKREGQVHSMLKEMDDEDQTKKHLQEQAHNVESNLSVLKERMSDELHEAGVHSWVKVGGAARLQQLRQIVDLTTKKQNDTENLKINISAVNYKTKLDADLLEEKLSPSKRDIREVEKKSRKKQRDILFRAQTAKDAMKGLAKNIKERAASAQARRDNDAKVAESGRQEQTRERGKLLDAKYHAERARLRAEGQAARKEKEQMQMRMQQIAPELQRQQRKLEEQLLAVKQKTQEELKVYQNQSRKPNVDVGDRLEVLDSKQSKVDQEKHDLKQQIERIDVEARDIMASKSREEEQTRVFQERLTATQNRRHDAITDADATSEIDRPAQQDEQKQAETANANLQRRIGDMKAQGMKRVLSLTKSLHDDEAALKMRPSLKHEAEVYKTAEVKLSQAQDVLDKEAILSKQFNNELKELQRLQISERA